MKKVPLQNKSEEREPLTGSTGNGRVLSMYRTS